MQHCLKKTKLNMFLFFLSIVTAISATGNYADPYEDAVYYSPIEPNEKVLPSWIKDNPVPWEPYYANSGTGIVNPNVFVSPIPTGTHSIIPITSYPLETATNIQSIMSQEKPKKGEDEEEDEKKDEKKDHKKKKEKDKKHQDEDSEDEDKKDEKKEEEDKKEEKKKEDQQKEKKDEIKKQKEKKEEEEKEENMTEEKGDNDEDKRETHERILFDSNSLRGTRNMQESNNNENEKPSADEAAILYGVVVHNGEATVSKITAHKVASGKVKLTTPDGVFLTSAFSLSSSENDKNPLARSTKQADGVHKRLLNIHQNHYTTDFLHSKNSKIGFIEPDPTIVIEEKVPVKVIEEPLEVVISEPSAIVVAQQPITYRVKEFFRGLFNIPNAPSDQEKEEKSHAIDDADTAHDKDKETIAKVKSDEKKDKEELKKQEKEKKAMEKREKKAMKEAEKQEREKQREAEKEQREKEKEALNEEREKSKTEKAIEKDKRDIENENEKQQNASKREEEIKSDKERLENKSNDTEQKSNENKENAQEAANSAEKSEDAKESAKDQKKDAAKEQSNMSRHLHTAGDDVEKFEEKAQNKSEEAGEKIKENVNTDKANNVGKEVKNKSKDMGQKMKESGEEGKENADEKFQKNADDVKDKVNGDDKKLEKTKEGAKKVSNKMKETGEKIKQGFNDAVEKSGIKKQHYTVPREAQENELHSENTEKQDETQFRSTQLYDSISSLNKIFAA